MDDTASQNSSIEAFVEPYKRWFGRLRDIRREEVHRLIAEIAHAGAWESRKAARFGLCGEVYRLMGDLEEFFLWCDECCLPRRMGGHCMNDFGFLADCSANIESSPTVHLFTHVDRITGKVPGYNGLFLRHHNVILLGPRKFEYMERNLEDLLAHEYVHWVLYKLFPRRGSVSEQFDNVYMQVKGLRFSIGPSFAERIKERLHTREGFFSWCLEMLDWYLRKRRYFDKIPKPVEEPVGS